MLTRAKCLRALFWENVDAGKLKIKLGHFGFSSHLDSSRLRYMFGIFHGIEMGAYYCAICRQTTFNGKGHIFGKSHQSRLRVVLLKFIEKVSRLWFIYLIFDVSRWSLSPCATWSNRIETIDANCRQNTRDASLAGCAVKGLSPPLYVYDFIRF